MSHCVNTRQLRQFKDKTGVVYPLTGFSDQELQDTLDEAEALVERVCGTRFYTLYESWLFDGSGTELLRFPPLVPYPLLSVSEVAEVSSLGDIDEYWVEGTDFVANAHFLTAGAVGGGSSVRVRRAFSTLGFWPAGLRNIRITGLWGWASCPQAVARAIKILAVETLIPGVAGLNSGDVSQQSWPDYTVSFRTDGGKQSPTGYLYVDRLLSGYISWSSLFLRDRAGANLVSSVAAPSVIAGEGIQVLRNDPNFLSEGTVWYNSTERVWKFFDGTNTHVVGVTSLASSPIASELEPRALKVYVGDPDPLSEGDLWYNSVEGVWKAFNGVATTVIGTDLPFSVSSHLDSRFLVNYTTDPINPNAGDMWFNTTEKRWKFFNGSSIVSLGGG